MGDIFQRILELGGLGIFIWYLIKGLKQQIIALQATLEIQKGTLEAQKSTLDAMERRVMEAEKMGELYRRLLDQLPDDLEKYKTVLGKLKDEIIKELEDANKRKDDKLASLTKSRLDEITKQEQILNELPQLRETLISTYDDIKRKLVVLDILQPGTPVGDFLKEAEEILRKRNESSIPKKLTE